ncbi:MAG: TonB-dependent receptor plug domain-containing protein [Gammaproteobacteria bacterium]|nr:TonB-dependent receptor plug domain-containing protein [Gammaproteobacteria bacterium]MBT3722002.1 TonB-dependent receptor plug domain-containing protein [Gammaproteobacteria bacterium]MBT4196807.1 TonB-dependent receptor plug domain-containing protein [Gammaproteobacteria bacterium]MBT4449126.1 TonB-dependent receptor plug domain-containing protein [Gammaproteobacteria bacterium]MBT4862291.1 TonB-dependent receptor plug domain-containing protein [Gammaproteobacteria bacterium]
MKNNSFISSYSLISLILFSASLQAQDYLAETDFFGEAPVVLTVSRMNKLLEDSPASVSVIDRQMIRNSGAREIADIFRMVPGMVIGYHFGHSPAVTYQGMGSEWQRQLQVLIDGRSVFVPSFGGVPWANLPLLLEDIERVEVTRGPNAVTYGANAFLATINIITRHAAEDLGAKITVTHGLEQDDEIRDMYFRVGNQYSDLDWRISGGIEEDDGYEVLFDSKQLKKLNLRTDFLTAYNQFWTLQAGINQSTFNRGNGSETNIFRDEETSNSYQNLKWELLQDEVTTTIQLTQTNQDVEDNFLSDPLNQELDDRFGQNFFSLLPDLTMEINFDRVSNRRDFEIYQNRNFNDKTIFVYGASTRKDNVKSFYLFNDTDTHRVRTSRLFSSIESKFIEDLIIDIGLMLEDTNYTDKELSGRLSIIKKIEGQHSLRLVSSSARRNPLLYEILGNTRFEIELPAGVLPFTKAPVITWAGNEDIQPEVIQSAEIGLFSEFENRQYSTDIKLFSYKITDQINESTQNSIDALTGLPQQFIVMENNGTTTVKGIEASLNYSPQHKKYRFYGGLSKVNVDSTDAKSLASYPELTAFAGGHIKINPYHQISTAISYVDDLSWMDSNSQLDDHIKLDLRYQYLINRKFDTKLELIGYNLYEKYAEYVNNDFQERSFLLRVSSRF